MWKCLVRESFRDIPVSTISPETQKERVVKRNGEDGYKIFKSKWIPAEEKYFNEQDIQNKCEIVFETE